MFECLADSRALPEHRSQLIWCQPMSNSAHVSIVATRVVAIAAEGRGGGYYSGAMYLAAIGDTPYNILLFLHILAMFVAFAPAFTHPFIDNQTRGEPTMRQSIFKGIAQRGMRIYGVALILGGVFGFGLSGMSGKDRNGDLIISMTDTWVLISIILWIAMNGVLHGMIIPGEKALANGDDTKGKSVETGGMVITVLLLITLYLMIFKPGA